ncbi:hypothetical protein [uncultured Eubacterium sp.]|nr:hypothetical protein [uncultured Eubacterium sp.]
MLILAAIAKELDGKGMNLAKVHIAAGLKNVVKSRKSSAKASGKPL